MEHLTIEYLTDFVKENEIELYPSHSKLCFPIIARIFRKMKHGIRFSGIKIDGDIIIDGHYRYLAALLADVALERYPYSKTSATNVGEWNTVLFDTNDWDTEAKISMLNALDAEYNSISIKTINALLK